MTLAHRQLRAFLAVADAGSVGVAANHIHMSQPALSRLIRETEQRLGTQLFERHAKGMTLTQAGETLVPYARSISFDLDQAEDALDALKGLKRGTVRLGTVATVARSILPSAVEAFLARSPEVRLEILEGSDDQVAAALVNRSVDIAILNRLSQPEELIEVGECRFDDVCAPFCSSSHPLAREPKPALEDVLAERWIMPARASTPRALFEDLVGKTGYRAPHVSVETTSPSAMIAFVKRTRFLGWLPRPVFAGGETAGSLCTLNVPELTIHRQFFIYRRERGLLPAAALSFLRELPLVAAGNGSAPARPGIPANDLESLCSQYSWSP